MPLRRIGKRIGNTIYLGLLLVVWALVGNAQVNNPSIISVTTAPSGACAAGLPNQQVASTGTQYSCQNVSGGGGTWGVVGAGSGGPPTGAASNCLTGTYPGPGLSTACVVAGVAGQAISPSSVTSTGTCPLTGSGSGLGCWIGTVSSTLPTAGTTGFDGIVAGTTALYATIGVAAPTTLITQAAFPTVLAAALPAALQAPQFTVITATGSGTYTTPTGALYLKVTVAGAGSGGAGGGPTATNGAAAAGSTTFGSLAAGAGQAPFLANLVGGAGGGASGGTMNITGNQGQSTVPSSSANPSGGGLGGASPCFGGSVNDNNAPASSGAGGGGGFAGSAADAPAGPGGGSGGCVIAFITSPTSTYTYFIETGGAGGAAGTSGGAGGNGAAGQIVVEAYFQ